MDDCISRLAAIEACHNYEDGKDAYAYGYIVEERLQALPSAQPTLKGWVCPLCGRGLSPFTMVCPCQNGKGWKITCKTL